MNFLFSFKPHVPCLLHEVAVLKGAPGRVPEVAPPLCVEAVSTLHSMHLAILVELCTCGLGNDTGQAGLCIHTVNQLQTENFGGQIVSVFNMYRWFPWLFSLNNYLHCGRYHMTSRNSANCIGGCAEVICKYYIPLLRVWASLDFVFCWGRMSWNHYPHRSLGQLYFVSWSFLSPHRSQLLRKNYPGEDFPSHHTTLLSFHAEAPHGHTKHVFSLRYTQPLACFQGYQYCSLYQ